MPRLYRPSIPVEVKCRVALRQLGESNIDAIIESNHADPSNGYMSGIGASTAAHKSLGRLLASLLPRLADHLNCNETDLHLDHDPALENRMKRTVVKLWRGKTRQITVFSPDANDQRHLIYREKHDHHIKTNVRGEHGQFPDNTIAKRERRRLKKIEKAKGVSKLAQDGKRGDPLGTSRGTPKRKWPSRPFNRKTKP